MSEGTYGGQPYQGADGLWHAQGADGIGYTYTQDANGFWYTQGASGNQLLWTGGGWADVNSGEAAQAMADHLSGLLTQQQLLPPTGGYGTDTDQLAAQLVATGDPASINIADSITDAEDAAAAVWRDMPPSDVDGDGTSDAFDVQSRDADVQMPGDYDPGDTWGTDPPGYV